VRILKLYKHVHDQNVKRQQRAAQHGQVTPGVIINENQAEDEDVAEEMRLAQEPDSKVGRKLSELSTRRVIILVLLMLFILPFFAVEDDVVFDTSIFVGLENVWDDWQQYNLQCDADASPQIVQRYRQTYEDSLLLYIYYHHGSELGCPQKEDFGPESGLNEEQEKAWEDEWSKCAAAMAGTNVASKFLRRLVWFGYSEPSDAWPCDGKTYGENNGPWIKFDERRAFAQDRLDAGEPAASVTDSDLVTFGREAFNMRFNHFWCNLKLAEAGDTSTRCDDSVLLSPPLRPDILEALTKPWEIECGKATGVSFVDASWEAGKKGCEADDPIECLKADYDCPARQAVEVPLEDQKPLRRIEYLDLLPKLVGKYRPGGSLPIVVIDQHLMSERQAILSITQTFFICIVLAGGAIMISTVANSLVLKPIERMIDKVKLIAANPLVATRIGDNMHRQEEEALERLFELRQNATGLTGFWIRYKHRNLGKRSDPLETVILEKTIIKIGGLLALGFGEAGGDVIGQNLTAASGAVKVLIPGKRITGVFGFCKIKNFSVLTEVLQDQVMLFVNQVAEIVHGFVDELLGAPNKNMGESFVLVWRIKKAQLSEQLHDMALASVAKVHAAVRKSPRLHEYSKHPGLLQRIQAYEVAVTFGLHSGWAIEGAIGSEMKIDVSYLSTNVNMATRLEELTRVYEVANLCSGQFAENLSEDVRSLTRTLDSVRISGFKRRDTLHTLDLDAQALSVIAVGNLPPRVHKKFKIRQLREQRKTKKEAGQYIVSSVFKSDMDISAMREKYTFDFLTKFHMAYQNYEAGEWTVARDMLNVTAEMLPGNPDGPSQVLLQFMDDNDFEVPYDWPGFRDI
jgi:class 3 adenylate cyclase